MLILRGLTALACFAAPWLIGDLLLSRISPYRPDIESLQRGAEPRPPGSVVLIGDCSIAPYDHILPPAVVPGTELLRVIGFGGSSAEEWFYLVHNGLPAFKEARHVVIGTSHPFRFKRYPTLYTSYLPMLMTWPQLFDAAAIDRRIDLAQGARFVLAKALPSFMASQTLRYQFFDAALPEYHSWYMKGTGANRSDAWRTHVAPPPPPLPAHATDNDVYFRKLSGLADAMKGRLIFMLTPRASWMKSDDFKRQHDEWLANCAKLGVHCLDQSAAMPDSDFLPQGDGLHLEGREALAAFWRKLSARLATDPRFAATSRQGAAQP